MSAALTASEGGTNLDAAIEAARAEMEDLQGRYPVNNRPVWIDGWNTQIEHALPLVVGCAVTAQSEDHFADRLRTLEMEEQLLLPALLVGNGEYLTLYDDVEQSLLRSAALGAASTLGAMRAGASVAAATAIGAAIRAQCAEALPITFARIVTDAALRAEVPPTQAALAGMAAAIADADEPAVEEAADVMVAALVWAGLGHLAPALVQRVRDWVEDTNMGSRFTVACYRLTDSQVRERQNAWWKEMLERGEIEQLNAMLRRARPDWEDVEMGSVFETNLVGELVIHPHYC